VVEQEPTDDCRALAALLTNLVDRAEYLSGLLDTLEGNHQLRSLVVELEQTGRRDELVGVLPNLMDHIEDLEASLADLVDSPDCMSAVLIDLTERTGHIDVLVADLERAIARSSPGA